MFKTFAIGLVIYLFWKIAEGFFSASKVPKEQKPPKPKNQDDDGFTNFEELE